MNVAIIGSGSWATALAKIVMHNVADINWYIRKQETIDEFIEIRRNPNHLEWAYFDVSRIHFSTDINQVIDQSELVILAIPSPYLKDLFQAIKIDISQKKVISAVKGMIPDENILVTDFLHTHFQIPEENLGMITGPCHAEEIALERLSYLTIGCKDLATAQQWRKLFDTPYVRTTPSNDIKGLEYASVMKNIYAIAAGMCSSLRYGDNFQAVLLTNAMHEIMRFTKAQSDIPRDITNSGYLGDVLVTAYSNFSRNRQFGQMIGMGYSVKAAQTEMEMIAEGYYGTKAIHLANKALGVDIPIVEAMYQILYKRKSPKTTIKDLTQKFE
ncbi:MAG: NAD(P)H-dependent glycerol-3-phosphate dehydrogenase [Paludibacteraceae bacterium]|jgi:glycerol-3-phosphate dehydrogenase (NAD(P)+)|nr:NAD(P)H-dependent glycerol-3-phosphate dehydrogenase [Paludibacteraceae bacterium]